MDHLADVGRRLVERHVRHDVQRRSWRDHLTGLPDRRGFLRQAAIMVAQAERDQRGLWCAFIDIDHFKSVNDLLGHEAGDTVLVAIADALLSTARGTDLAARWGGDEFVLLGIGAPPDERGLEQRIVACLRALPAGITAAWTAGVTAGAVATNAADAAKGNADRLSVLMAAADARMYARRRRHREANRVRDYRSGAGRV